ncbi:MAG: HAD family hydrolase [Patescibacteria group bacterium]|nr:HAD family hydrolase [Patescibacteria group bacterium]
MPKFQNITIRGILFDWNGTLVNDLLPAYRGWMACFHLLGLKEISLLEFRRTYALPWQSFYRRHGADASTIRRHRKELSVIYRRYQRNIRLSPGAKRLIRQLHARDIRLGILSDDPRTEIVRRLKRWGLRHAFTFIGTSERYPPKPSPAGVRAFLRSAKRKPGEVLFVGDLPDDISAGRSAGVATVAYLKGWRPAAMLKKAKPGYAIQQLKEIFRLVQRNQKV